MRLLLIGTEAIDLLVPFLNLGIGRRFRSSEEGGGRGGKAATILTVSLLAACFTPTLLERTLLREMPTSTT